MIGRLTVTRGLPGSGKSTWARSEVAADPERRTVRVNRDDLRVGMFGARVLPYAQEQVITATQHTTVEALLRSGHRVIVDDTNLRSKYLAVLLGVAVAAGAEWDIVDFNLPLETCLIRDAGRDEGRVGEDAIRRWHDTFVRPHRGFPPVPVPKVPADPGVGFPVDPYVVVEEGPHRPGAWLFDMDGTLALMGDRSPYDWARVGEDEPNEAVCDIARALGAEDRVIVVSGRDETCRPQTEKWLGRHEVPFSELFMRPAGSCEKDAVVKYRIFNDHIRDRYLVRGVVDDRDQVVALWRALGLTCLQAAPGSF